MTKGRSAWWLLLPTLVVVSAFVDFRIRQFPTYPFETYIPAVVGGTYEAPMNYRVLVPFTNSWFQQSFGWSPAAVWHMSRLFWFAVAYIALFIYLRTWFSPRVSAGGVLAVAATLPLTYTNSWAHPDATPELALFTLGCLAIVRHRFGWLSGLVALATLNRETAAFLVVAFLFTSPGSLRDWGRAGALAALWAVPFLAVRFWRGLEHYDYWQLFRNLEFLALLPPEYDFYKRAYAWSVVVLFGPALGLVAARWSHVPPTARRLLATALPFVVVASAVSSIIETRIFVPLYPLTLPAVMFAVLGAERMDGGIDGGNCPCRVAPEPDTSEPLSSGSSPYSR